MTASREPQSFMEAIDDLAHCSSNTLATIAERIGRSTNYLRKACSQYDAAHPFRGDLIVPMTLASADDPDGRNYVAIDYLCRAVGGAFFRVPTSIGRFGLTPNVLREVSEYLQAVADGSADRAYTPEEADRIRREGMQVVSAILADLDHIDRLASRNTSPAVVSIRSAG